MLVFANVLAMTFEQVLCLSHVPGPIGKLVSAGAVSADLLRRVRNALLPFESRGAQAQRTDRLPIKMLFALEFSNVVTRDFCFRPDHSRRPTVVSSCQSTPHATGSRRRKASGRRA